MSIMPYIEAPQTSIDQITEFRGLNHNAVIGDNEFYEMLNMSYQDYPAISVRFTRGTPGSGANHNNTYYPVYDGTDWHVPFGGRTLKKGSSGWTYDNQAMDVDIYVTSDVSMVDYNGDEIVTNDAIAASGCATVAEMNENCRGAIPPTDVTDGALWLDTSEYPPKMMKYSENISDWCEITTYMALNAMTVGDISQDEWNKVCEGDAVEIPGLTTFVESTSGDFIYAPADKTDKIIITKIGTKVCALMPFNIFFQGSIASGSGLHIVRKMKSLDFFFECNNRLWGCKYSPMSTTTSGQTTTRTAAINEIYASKLGNPTNWDYYANTSIDSYTMSIGSGKAWTGGIEYQGTPVFFKEDCIYRIYGNYPSNYQLKTIFGMGVASGKSKTLAKMHDAVYYVGKDGVYRWTGGSPERISDALGHPLPNFTAGGAIGEKYYLIAEGKFYVYNDVYNTWHKESFSVAYDHFLTNNDGLYACVTSTIGYLLPGAKELTGESKSTIGFSLTTGNIGYMSPFRKYLNKINLKIKMDLTTKCYVEIKYDSENDWHKVTDIRPTGKTSSVTVPIIPHRCDHFALRISGVGDMQLIGIYKFYEEGSEYD